MTTAQPAARIPAQEEAARWLPVRQTEGGLPLFCLPHAGGGASAFRTWQGTIAGVAVRPVQPPGREARLREPGYERMAPLVATLAPVLLDAAGERPYAVYGHSLGALVGFELLREIRRLGGRAPAQLIVSGCVAPHCAFDDGPPVRHMTRPEVVAMMRDLGGTPHWLLADPSAVDMILPAVRADFTVKETYAYRDEPPLPTPITVLASTDDPRAGHDLQARWAEQTTAGCAVHMLAGGHFAVFQQSHLTHKHLGDALRPWTTG